MHDIEARGTVEVDVNTPQSDGPTHLYCCEDRNLGLCGKDLTGLQFVPQPEEHLCGMCDLLDRDDDDFDEFSGRRCDVCPLAMPREAS